MPIYLAKLCRRSVSLLLIHAHSIIIYRSDRSDAVDDYIYIYIYIGAFTFLAMEESRAPPERSGSLDSFLGASEVILTILKEASTVSPLPFLSDAAKLSLGILNAVQVSLVFLSHTRRTLNPDQAVRKNKVLWIDLAQDIARLVVVVVRKVDNSNLDSDTLDQIGQLRR